MVVISKRHSRLWKFPKPKPQWTGFYMIGASFMKELIEYSIKNQRIKSHTEQKVSRTK